MHANTNISRRTFIKSTTASIAAAASSFSCSVKAQTACTTEGKPPRSEKFRVAAVQMNALPENLEHNIQVHRRIVKDAANDNCRLVMFPELSVTAHLGHESMTALAERAAEGVIYKAMHDLAKAHRIIIAYGFCETYRGAYYNSCALVGPAGLIGIHRKAHLSRDEYLFFRMGRSLDVLDLGFCKAGILICYDASFFEAWRVLALKGADMLLLPHAGRSGPGVEIAPQKQRQQLQKILDGLPGRYGIYARDNCVFAVYANQVGYNGHSTHSGAAYIVGPNGKLLSKSRAVLDDVWVSAGIDKALQTRMRKSKNSTLKDRRPEMYTELTRMI